MTTLQKGILWAVGCLGFVFALSIALSWYSFGFLDADTLWLMGLMFVPLLGGAGLMMVMQAEGKAKQASEKPVPAPRSEVFSGEREASHAGH